MADIVRADKQGAPGKFWRQRATSSGYKEVGTNRDVVVVSVTPTDLETTALDSGDVAHTAVLNFADVVAQNGQSGVIEKLIVVDKDAQGIDGELWLFSTSPTIPAADAAWSISDADAAKVVAIIRTATDGVWFASALNKIGQVGGVDIPFKCDAADVDLYGAWVVRGTPTYTASGLTFNLTVARD